LWPVPVQLLGLVALELKQHGVSVGTLLSETEVTEEFLFDSEKTLPYRTTQAILEKAVDLSPVPHLGFVIGAQQSPSGLGVLGYGINCCVNLRETIEIVNSQSWTIINSAVVGHRFQYFLKVREAWRPHQG
jgi:hypothetical protein